MSVHHFKMPCNSIKHYNTLKMFTISEHHQILLSEEGERLRFDDFLSFQLLFD